MDWKSYHSYKTMMSFLDEVKHNNKDGLIDLKDIGKTAEGRLLKMIKFGHGKSHVFIDAGTCFFLEAVGKTGLMVANLKAFMPGNG